MLSVLPAEEEEQGTEVLSKNKVTVDGVLRHILDIQFPCHRIEEVVEVSSRRTRTKVTT